MKHLTYSIQLFCTLSCLICPLLSYSSTIRVPSEQATIQAGINIASDGDTVLVAPGIYTGEGNRNIELLGKAIAVISEAGAGQTTIDVEGQSDRGFHLHQEEGLSTLIQGFRIINAASGSFGSTAIDLNNSSPTIEDCILENNTRGLFLINTAARIKRCTIRNNAPKGGITSRFNSFNAEVRNCLIIDNSSDAQGGAIFASFDNSPSYINCTLVGNTASQGGGGIAARGDEMISMRNCIIWGNTAPKNPNLGAFAHDITFSNIEGICLPFPGNISEDPQFLNEQYELSASSPCIDAASPADGLEPDNTQVNMGTYGTTSAAALGEVNKPIIENISPASGSTSGGESLVISGQRFGNSPGVVSIGGNVASISSWSSTTINCLAPGHVPGKTTIEVTNTQSLSTQLTFSYIYEGSGSFRVPSEYATIQEAIYCASNGDTVWVAPGVYTGAGNRNIELLGKSIAVISEAGAEQTTIDVEGLSAYGFYIHQQEGHEALIKGFKIINSTADDLFATGGIYLNGGSPSIQECILEGNARGLFLQDTEASINGCVIRNNAPWGGVTSWFSSSDAVVKNCLISNNFSKEVGGGIRVFVPASSTFLNCTIVGNAAARSGGGVYVEGDDMLRMRNCIIWGNTAPNKPNVDAYVFDITYSTVEGLCLPFRGNLSEDPKFVDDQYHLSGTSPCIDSGSPADGFDPDNTQVNMGAYGQTIAAATGSASAPIIEDINPASGAPTGGEVISISGQRFGSNPGNVKIGGVSATINTWSNTQISCIAPSHLPGKVSIEVTNAASLKRQLSFGYSYQGTTSFHVPSDFATIQGAIYCASDGDTIWVAPGTYTGAGNRDIEFLGKAVLVISESGAMQTTIDAEGIGAYGFYLHQDEGPEALVKGFRIINATGGNFFSSAGIHLDRSSARIQDCVLENNSRGLLLENTSSHIENCAIRNNAPWGGLYSWFSSSEALIKNCLITGNFSTSDGGGVRVDVFQSPLFINCTIAGNTSERSGGGIYADANDSLRMRNSIVWANTAVSNPEVAATLVDIRFSNLKGDWPEAGNRSENPCFVDFFAGDFHLNSASPLIDAGDPNDSFDREPLPNGGRINMGRYGNTAEASSFEAITVINDFDYELGCAVSRLISLSGKNFGSPQGNGQILLGENEVSSVALWTDTLVQFSVDANLIEGSPIILSTDQGGIDSIPGTATYSPFAQFVSGEVSGIWTADCPGTYILTGPATVPAGASLTIEPGVKVLVDKRMAGTQAQLKVEGTLNALGTANQPILFSVIPFQASPGSWMGIELDMQGFSDKAHLSHCIVEYARNGIRVDDSEVLIDSCTVRHNSNAGIRWFAEAETIAGELSNSQIYSNGGFGVEVSTRASSSGSTSVRPDIYRNAIEQNGKGGIFIASTAVTPPAFGSVSRSASATPYIFNNTIKNNSGFGVECLADGDWADGLGFDFFYNAYTNPKLEGNLIINNKGGFKAITKATAGNTWLSHSESEVINCTIANNGPNALIAADSAHVKVTNTILVGPSSSVLELGGGEVTASYSTIIPPFEGDAMVNELPLFFNENDDDYRLMTTSAQLDTGNNEVVVQTEDLQGRQRIFDGDDNGTAKVDIGAIEYELPSILSQSKDPEVCAESSYNLEVTASGPGLLFQWQKGGVPIVGATKSTLEVSEAKTEDQGSYTCMIVDELGGVILSEEIQLTVRTLQMVSLEIEASATEICSGTTVEFSATASNGGQTPVYSWLLNDEVVGTNSTSWSFDNFDQGDEVACILQSSESCVASRFDTASISLVVHDLPIVSLTLETDTLCIDHGDLTLVGGIPLGGIYSGPTVHSDSIFDPSLAGIGMHTITYSFTNEEGCTNSVKQELIVNAESCITGIHEDQIKSSVSVFPNPSNGYCTILLDNWAGETLVQLLDVHGRVYLRQESRSTEIPLEALPKGVFLLQVSNGTFQLTRRVIIQ